MQEWLRTTDALQDIIYVEGNYNSSLPLTQSSFIYNNKFHILEPNLQRVSNIKE